MSDKATVDAPAKPLPIARLIGWLLLGAGVMCAIAMAITPWVRTPERTQLAPASITSSRGAAHLVELPRDDRRVLRPSRDASVLLPVPMQVLENEQPIGRIASSVDEVINKGEGRFAYVDPVLAFSSSDGSDPRTNGRTYVVERPIKARLAGWFFADLAIVIGLGLAFSKWTTTTAIALLRFGSQPVIASRARGILGAPSARHLAFSLTTVALVAQLLLMWWGSASAHFGVAGFLPVSDALGYYNCAVWIAAIDTGNASGGVNAWCARRVLYPAMLSSLLGLSGWRPSIALVLQAMMIGLSAGVLLLALQRTFGWVTAILATLGVLAFAKEFAIGGFVTEAFGLPAGVMGLALLLLAIRGREPAAGLLVLGLALISVGMAIRAGALFALPLLGLWLLFITRSMALRLRMKLLAAGVAAIAVGPVLQYAMVVAVGADPGNSGGNFAPSLYGLSTGSRDWSQAYRDFHNVFGTQPEPLAFQIVQKAALQKIVNDPYTFIGALAAAGKAFAQSLFTFGPLVLHNTLASWLFCFGLLLCVLNRHQPAPLLLLTLCVGELISAPFVYDSGGHRVLAVTVAARVAVAAYAVAWLAGLLVRETKNSDVTSATDTDLLSGDRPLAAASVVFGLTFLVLAIAPATWISSQWRLTPLAATGACPADQLEVVAQPGRESMRITFGDRSLPLGDEELGSQPGWLELDPIVKHGWWAREFTPPQRGFEIIYAVQRVRENFGVVIAAFSTTPLTIVDDRPLSFCLARQASPTVKLGDLNGHEILGVVDRTK